MRTQLIQYVDLLFAGSKDSEDIHQEILQNTLDRYDDLILEGKTPEAAYRLAILGIGDINEILGTQPSAGAAPAPRPTTDEKKVRDAKNGDTPTKKLLRAVAVGMYILCPVPMIVLAGGFGMGILGVCSLLAMVAVATVLIILGSTKDKEEKESDETELEKSIGNLIWAVGLALYFAVSFLTQAWYITWVIFPMIGAVEGLFKAILDFKGAMKHEN